MLVFYTFLASAASPIYRTHESASARFASHPSAHAHNPNYTASTWGGDGLKNRLFFSFAFIETITWFWIWVTLREERPELVRKTLSERLDKDRDE